MRRLPAPTDSVKDVYETCISTYRDQKLKDKLASVTPTIVKASQNFDNKVGKNETHKIPAEKSIDGIVSAKEMLDVYSTKFSKQNSPGRHYYDKYLAAPPHGLCPICGVRFVSTLDHYLPKAQFPALAVTPKNLVPTCYDCNLGNKKTFVPRTAEEEPLHPYFDDVEKVRWLAVRLYIKDNCLIPAYFASKPDEWSDLLFSRVKNHMHIYGLPRLYEVHAEEEIVSCKRRWNHIYRNCGRAILKQSFVDDCNGREEILLNSWQSALYRAIIDQLDTVCTWLDLET